MQLYFGGGECHAHVKKLQQSGVVNAQLSFFHLKEKRIKQPEIFNHSFKVLVSSGAPALRGTGQQDNLYYKRYFQEYLSFLDKYRNKISAATEFDLYELDEETRAAARQELAATGIPIIYMWEKGRDWEEMCKKYRYLGIPDTDISLVNQIAMLQIARRHKTLVHRFTPLRLDYLLKVPYYSVSNSRWISGEKFGSLFIWCRSKLLEIKNDDKDSRKQYKSQLELLGLDFDKIMQNDHVEVGKANIYAWLELEKYVNKVSVLRQYFEFDTAQGPMAASGQSRAQREELNKTGLKEKYVPQVPTITEKELQEGSSRSSLLRQKAILCDNCYAAKRCKFYEPAVVCKLNKEFRALSPSGNPNEVLGKIKGMIGTLEERANRALYFEAVDGGVPDKNATDLVKMILDYNMKLHDIMKEKGKVKGTVTIDGDDLLSKIFARKEPETKPIDAEILDTKQ